MPIGPIMLDLEGLTLSAEEIELLQHPAVGGVILFTRNYATLDQLQALIFDIRHSRTSPILISVDQEGGRVQRFKQEFTQLPSQSVYGKLFEKNNQEGLATAKLAGWLMASELLSIGIDFSFTPVLDCLNDQSAVIGNRGFHENPQIISVIAKAYIEGMNDAGMQAIGKHYPGHGSIIQDSHFEISIDSRSSQEIMSHDIIPFAELARSHLAGIMPAHIIYSNIDSLPATYSSFWLKKVLRENILFKGAIISDDLSMSGAGIFSSITERVHTALNAGCDMALICNDRASVIKALDEFKDRPSHLVSEQRLLKLSGHFKLTRYELQKMPEWQKANAKIAELCTYSVIS